MYEFRSIFSTGKTLKRIVGRMVFSLKKTDILGIYVSKLHGSPMPMLSWRWGNFEGKPFYFAKRSVWLKSKPCCTRDC